MFVDDKKLGGILVKSEIKGTDFLLNIGIGVNLAVSPIDTSTCLKDHGIEI